MNCNGKPCASTRTVRCAVYTRKSSEEGLEQEFNSLDAQRESGEAFILSQAHEGWRCLPDRYDDGGFSGGTLERPALKRLLADVDAAKVDCVIVYKIDRLSRSLLDFARIMEVFDKKRVAFAAVTQQLHTATSMGRLVLNVLLSFAQFEREIISERTRDKIAAARRKGKWSGGHPLLGYDIDRQRFRLVVNEGEAACVRAIFELYLQHQGLIPVVQELDRRGWLGKRWTTRKGRERGGKVFTKTCLYKLLTNVAYIGKVRYKREVHSGEQPAIVDEDVFQRVQTLLQRQKREGMVRRSSGAMLKGLLRCAACGCAMTPAHTTRRDGRRYRYYTCINAQKRGWDACPAKSIPAEEMDRLVTSRVRDFFRNSELLDPLLAAAQAQIQGRLEELEQERARLKRDLAAWQSELRDPASAAPAAIADLQECSRRAQQRLLEIRQECALCRQEWRRRRKITQTLADSEVVWESLAADEQRRIVRLLVERVDYDGAAGKIFFTCRSLGVAAGAPAGRSPEGQT